VLPFRSLTGAAGDERFDKGFTEALIKELEKSAQIQAAPAASVQRYIESGAADPVAAGRELGVKVIVIGMAQRLAGRFRLNVQMISTQDGRELWSGSFDGDSSGMAGLAAQVSEKIAQRMPSQDSSEPP
jgi:TolB-like protein